MKTIITTLLLLISTQLFSQCVEVDRFFTGGLHYLANKDAKGFQFEIGSTGSESNISYYAVINGFSEKYLKDSVATYPKMVFGLKFAYRFIRVENSFNVYATTLIGQDIEMGIYHASSIKVLTSLGRKVAISIEPSYLTRQKTFLAQAGINIILD